MEKIDWALYDKCPSCYAKAGNHCVDMRYFSRYCDTPHATRHKIKTEEPQDANPTV